MTTGTNTINSNLSTDFLSQIQWHFHLGVFQGSVEYSPLAQAILGSVAEGEWEVTSAVLSGCQQTKLSWYRDEGYIKLRVISVSEPK